MVRRFLLPLLSSSSPLGSLRSSFHLSQSVMASTELATTTSASGTPQGPPPHSDPVEESQVVARLLEENARLRQQLNFDNKTTPEEVEEAVSDLRSSIQVLEEERRELVKEWCDVRDATFRGEDIDMESFSAMSAHAERHLSRAQSMEFDLLDMNDAYECAKARASKRCPDSTYVDELVEHIETLRAFRESVVVDGGASARDKLSAQAHRAADAAFSLGVLALGDDRNEEDDLI